MARARTLERGYLLLADLSGYTAYVAASEPEHAPIIVADFIETVIARLRGTFRLVKLEGDAAFMWAPADRVDGSLLLDAVDAAYFGFRRRLQSASLGTTCDCNACRRVPQLDLKFVVHVGDALRHRIAGRDELTGRDVILAHRLLKGSASERAGAQSYLLLTAAAVETLAVDADALRLISVTERYSELGDVRGYLLDLGARWEGERQRTGRPRPAGKLAGRVERLLPATPSVAWEYLTAPRRRLAWEGLANIEESALGRRGIGSTASCLVGRLASLEEILDWRPFDVFVRRVDHSEFGRVTTMHRLSEMAGGILLEVSWFAPARVSAEMEGFIAQQSEALDRLTELLSREAETAALPVSVASLGVPGAR